MHKPQENAGSGTQPLPATSQKRLVAFLCLFFVLSAAAVFAVNGFVIKSVVELLRLALLLCASYSDLRTHRVNDLYSAALFMSGFFGIGNFAELLPKFISFAVILGILTAVYYLFPKKAIGGADVKVLSVLAFVYSINGIITVMISMVAILLVGIITLIIMKKRNLLKERLALFPVISVAVLINILL